MQFSCRYLTELIVPCKYMERQGKMTLCHASAQATKGRKMGASPLKTRLRAINSPCNGAKVQEFVFTKICLAVRCNGDFKFFSVICYNFLVKCLHYSKIMCYLCSGELE